MAGNRVVFDEALRKSRAALERQEWLEALTEAVRAVQEYPGDLDARHTVAIALFHNKKYDQAAQMFEELRKHRGDDALTLAYLARSYEGNRQPKQAVATLLTLATLTQNDGQMDDAQEAFEEAVRLAPADEQPRLAMAQFFLDLGDARRAAEQCVEIARLRLAAGDAAGAEEAVTEALTLDPNNGNAHTLRAKLSSATPPVREPTGALIRREGTGELRAAQVQIDHLIARAMQEQAIGNGTEALNAYLKAVELGSERADVAYNLATLLQERGDHEQAVPLLRHAAQNDEFALSSHFALGESLRALGKTRQAADAFNQALTYVNLADIGRGEADDLIAMFRAAADAHEALGDLSRAASLYTTLAGVFQNKRWGRELGDQMRMRARALNERSMAAKLERIGTGTLPGEVGGGRKTGATASWGTLPVFDTAAAAARPIDVLAEDPFASLNLPEVDAPTFAPLTPLPLEGCSDEVQRYIAASTRFMDQGLIHAAVDACYEVIRLDPTYVPVHLRIGEIFERDGLAEAALQKYRTVIDIYTARQQPMSALDAYRHFLDLSPDSLVPRGHLAQLLRASGQTVEAVEQVLMVADTLSRMGQHSRALQEFHHLLQWAPPSATIHKAYGQTLLKMGRWNDALQEFRRAARHAPDDAVAFAQVNLTLAIIGEDEQAISQSFDAVLQRLQAQPAVAEAVLGEYRAALMLKDTSLLHYLLGRVQQATAQHASAMLSFRQALSLIDLEDDAMLAPAIIHAALAESLVAQEQPDEALEELLAVERLIEQQPADAATHPLRHVATTAGFCQQLAKAYTSKGDQAEAIRAWKRCVQLNPHDVEGYTQLADLYFRQGKLQQALEQYDWLASMFEDQQRLDDAITTLERAATLAPNSLALRERLGRLLLRRGHIERGLREIEAVIALHQAADQPASTSAAMHQAAEVYTLLSRYDEAVALYRSLVDAAPDDLDTRHLLVTTLLLQGDHAAALAEQRIIAQRAAEQDDRRAQIEALSQLVALDPADAAAAEQLTAAVA
jgi:tetratricopeptide (TPR) repeat protein